MPLFQRLLNHPSPLLPSVPLEGTQTVAGLRELERRARLQPLPQPHSEHPARGTAAQRNRYQGPHVWDLPVDALRAAPVEWERFLHGGSLQDAYNVPDSTAMLLERLDENIVTYLANYIRMAWVLLAIAGYMNPKAALGVIALLLMLAANVGLRQADVRGPNAEMAGSMLMVAVPIVIIWTRCLTVLVRWMFHAVLVTALHGSLRVSRTEVAGAQRNGVSFSQVLGFDQSHPDPHRVFRELYVISWGAVTDVARPAALWCRQQLRQTVALLPYRRRPLIDAYLH